MGYRSEVVFAIEKEVVPLFIAHIGQDSATQNFCFKLSDYHTKDYCEKGHWLFTWESVKWYQSYPEIRAITSFIDEKLQNLPESFDDGNEYYKLVMVGEEIEDITQQGWAFDEIYVSRRINF